MLKRIFEEISFVAEIASDELLLEEAIQVAQDGLETLKGCQAQADARFSIERQ